MEIGKTRNCVETTMMETTVIGYKLKVTVTVTLTARRRQQYICFADTKMAKRTTLKIAIA